LFTSVQGLEGGIMYIHSRFSGEMREPEGMLFPVFRLQKILSPLYCVIFLGPAPNAGGWPRMLVGEPCSPGDRPRLPKNIVFAKTAQAARGATTWSESIRPNN